MPKSKPKVVSIEFSEDKPRVKFVFNRKVASKEFQGIKKSKTWHLSWINIGRAVEKEFE